MYSGPLSHRMASGLPRHSMIRSSERITRSDGSEKSTSIPQVFAVEVVNCIEQPDAAPIGELVVHEVHRPALINRGRDRQRQRLLAHQAMARLDPQVQIEFAVNPVDALVVPFKALHVAQVKEAQAKAPVALVVRQSHQPVRDEDVRSIQLGLVAVAGLADAKRFARQLNRG